MELRGGRSSAPAPLPPLPALLLLLLAATPAPGEPEPQIQLQLHLQRQQGPGQQQQQQPDVFRTELFPEQLQQQQLQLATQQLQAQMQEIQRRLQVAGSPQAQQALLDQQSELLRQLQETQRQQQVLQERLQAQLSGQPVQRPEPERQFVQRPEPERQFVQRPEPDPEFVQRPEPDPPFVQRPEPDRTFIPQPQPVPRQTPPPPPEPQPQPQPQRPLPEAGPPCATSAGEAGTCRPLVKCITFYAEVPDLRRQTCELNSDGVLGVCCPHRKRPTDVAAGLDRPNNGVLRPPPPPRVEIPPLTPQQLGQAAAAALQRIQERLALVARLFQSGLVVQIGTPAAWHLEFFQTSNATLQQGEQAQKGVEASVSLVNEFQLTPDQGAFALPEFSVLNTVIADTCPRTAACQQAKYRSADGSCNNLQHDRWGKAGTALQRVLPPKYGDGVNSPRSEGLPSARVVSTVFASDADNPYDNFTLLVMQWGQFLDHDLTHTPVTRGQNGAGLTCCINGDVIEQRNRHPDCFPIELPREDHVFARFGERCMDFVRSLPAPRPECNFGPREQMNQITGYLDGSNIYGSNTRAQHALRTGRGGLLRTQNVRGRPMLPENPDECTDDTERLACFKAGDSRVNEQVELAVMHTMWMREHNRVATVLARLNPRWDDETLFQEARRIVVAEMQHITYNEFLPLILGRDYMEKFDLLPRESGHTQLYDPELNAGITNVFATAAFRFGHTLIQSNMQGFSKFGTLRENLVLHKNQFEPFILYNEGTFDNFLRGLSTQTCQRFDRFFSKELTDRLFQGDLDFGLDLVALNIQRGRDHGIPPYNDWREVCGLPRARSWQDLLDVMDQQSVAILQRLYRSVDDVDLFVAGVAEKPLKGAMLGQTFVCLVGDQFARLRRGDRFFYEEAGQPSSFTEDQLNSIRKTSLSRIMCDNSDDLAQMQPLAFFQASFANQRVGCESESMPRVDLRPWQGERI